MSSILKKLFYSEESRSEGFPRTGLFHPWVRWGRGPAAGNSSVSSSRDQVGMRRVGMRETIHVTLHIICNSRHEPIGVRGFFWVLGRFLKILGLRERTKEENTCKMLLISPYCNHIQKCPEY